MNKISISISYSSTDHDQIDEVIKSCQLVSDDIQISSFNKFFNGDPEDISLLLDTYDKNKDLAKFHLIDYDSVNEIKFPSTYFLFKFCHNYLRYNNILNSKYNYILFLDSDEVIDSENFNEFLQNLDFNQHRSYFFNVYWYFRNKKYQAKTHEESSIIMTDKRFLSKENIFSIHERHGLPTGEIIKNCKGKTGNPLFHHYSWAKGKNELECKKLLLQKVKSWGHSKDRDWASLIEEEFSRPFNGRDFVHGYEYKILE